MPGLFGFFGHIAGSPEGGELNAMEKALQPTEHEPRQPYRIERHTGAFAAVGLTHHGVLDPPMASSGPVTALVDGWLWPTVEIAQARSATGTSAAETCLALYEERGLDFLEYLNGEYCLVLIDHEKQLAVLANDRFGLRPLQVYRTENTFFFAPEAKALFACGALEPRLDRRTLMDSLCYGRVLLGAGTFFQGVEVLEPASTLRFDARSGEIDIERRGVSSYRAHRESIEPLVEDVADAFRAAVRRRLRPDARYGLHLSGGLDSRLLAAVMAEELGDRAPLACTFGMESSGELALAGQVAGALGLPSRTVTLSAADFLEHAAAGVWRTEGLDLLSQSYAFAAFPQLATDVDVMSTGLALDLPMGGSFLTDALLAEGADDDVAFRHVEKKVRTMHAELVGRLFGDAGAAEDGAAHESTAGLHALWRAHAEGGGLGDSSQTSERAANLADSFLLRWRVWRIIIQRQVWHRMFYEDMTPSFDDDLFDLLLTIPARERLGHRFYQRVLQRLAPALMDIPYQRTLLPPSAPVELWPRAARLEAERERLLFDTWKTSGGRVYVPYRRYFSNYDEWMRLDPAWHDFFDKLFTGKDIALADFGVRPDVVRELLAEHRSGDKNRRQTLLQLGTLELLLRAYF